MTHVDLDKFLAEDKELRVRTKEMRIAITDEFTELLKANGGRVDFAPVDDPIHDTTRLCKGFRINNEGTLQVLNELKGDKPLVYYHNPYGTWYDMPNSFGFYTIRYWSACLTLLRNAVKKH